MTIYIILILVEIVCAVLNIYSFSHNLKWDINRFRILFLVPALIYFYSTDYKNNVSYSKENMLTYLFAAMIINGLQLAYIKYKEKKDKQIRD